MADISTLAQKQIAQGQALIDQIQDKIKKTVDEFARGEISREQFNKIYEHYQSQVSMATALMMEADNMALASQFSSGETIALRNKLLAKAKALTVYYHATGLLLETIGDFDVPLALISPVLNNISQEILQGRSIATNSDKFKDQWLLYVPGRFSTTVMLFSNEPSHRQITVIEGMHRDFENANDKALRSGEADSSMLVYPFQAFVRRSMTSKPG